MDLRPRTQAELLQPVLVADEHGRGAVADLGRGRGRHDPAWKHGLQLGGAIIRDAGADALIHCVHTLRAFCLRRLRGDRHNLSLELASLCCRVRTLLRHEAKLVHILLGETVLLSQQLCSTKLRERLGAHAKLLQILELLAVLGQHGFRHGLAMARLETVDDAGADRHRGHDLNPTCNDAVVDATHHGRCSLMDCLLRGAALAVHGGAGHALREFL
mmetsp:Transcript_84900/g.240608  ORF Transcript_84900/g.240608 Transcript_84900/m.240608 type:complete len:216 (-) Transcript_84900:322-969(-)